MSSVVYADRDLRNSTAVDQTCSANDPLILLSTAHELGYGTPATLTRYIDDGRLPVYRVGSNGWRKVRLSDLNALSTPTMSAKDREYAELKAHAKRVAAQAPPCSPATIQEIVTVLSSGGGRFND